MSDEGSSKVAHVAGVGLLGFGAIFARVADDCGRVGARGASMLDDGARFGRASALADDGFRASRAPTLADDGLRSAHASTLVDDAANLGRAGALADDGATAARPVAVDARAGLLEHSYSGEIGGELAKFAVDVTLELLPNIDAGYGSQVHPHPDAPAAERSPVMMTLLPVSPAARALVYGDPHDPKNSPPFPEIELAEQLDLWRANDLVGLLTYSIGPAGVDRPLALALPDGQRVTDSEIHRQCRARRLNCVVLACSPEPPAARGTCGKVAGKLWSAAVEGRGAAMSTRAFLARLLTARADSKATRGLVVSRVDGSASGDVGIVRSKLRAE